MVFGWSKSRLAEIRYRGALSDEENSSSSTSVYEPSMSYEFEDSTLLIERPSASSWKMPSVFRRRSNNDGQSMDDVVEEWLHLDSPRATDTRHVYLRRRRTMEKFLLRRKKLCKRNSDESKKTASRDVGWKFPPNFSSFSLSCLFDEEPFAASSPSGTPPNGRSSISKPENSGVTIRRKLFELSCKDSGESMEVLKFEDDSGVVDDNSSSLSDFERENSVAWDKPQCPKSAWVSDNVPCSLKKSDEHFSNTMEHSNSTDRLPVWAKQPSNIERSWTGFRSGEAEVAESSDYEDVNDLGNEVPDGEQSIPSPTTTYEQCKYTRQINLY